MKYHKLKEQEAIEMSIAIWEHLAKTSGDMAIKREFCTGHFFEMKADCPLCEMLKQKDMDDGMFCTDSCPYGKKYGNCFGGESIFQKWLDAQTPAARRRYAKKLLEELKTLMPKREPEADMSTVLYKGFRIKDGKLTSLVRWADLDGIAKDVGYTPEVITYEEGEVTHAPRGTQGVFIEEDLEECKSVTKGNVKGAPAAIYEVYPIGKKGKGWIGRTTYPAILVGKRLLTINEPEPPPRPEPKFKVGDMVIGVSSYAKYMTTPQKIDSIHWSEDPNSGGSPKPPRWLYRIDGCNYLGEMLELAPKEEWVDVTAECTFEPERHFLDRKYPEKKTLIWIRHKGKAINLLGLNKLESEESLTDGYKIEVVSETHVGAQWFRVLKLVKS